MRGDGRIGAVTEDEYALARQNAKLADEPSQTDSGDHPGKRVAVERECPVGRSGGQE